MIETPALHVMTANLHLFGRLARVGPDQRETPLYYHDFKRLEAIASYIDQRSPDIVGLQEVWDPLIQHELSKRLKETYPYQFPTPWARGMQGAIDAVNKRTSINTEALEEQTAELVGNLARNHYQLTSSFIWNLVDKMVPEDLMMRLLQRFFGVNYLWGAGLLFLSRYPIDPMQSSFKPYEAKADLDRFTYKGVLKAIVDVPGMGPVTTLLTHLQEGTSKKSVAARMNQLRAIRRIIDQSDFPVIAMGDFNVEREARRRDGDERRRFARKSGEYRNMLDILNLRDAYPRYLGDLNALKAEPGYTYLHGPIARHKGIPDETEEQALVVDYVLYDQNFKPVWAKVDNGRDFYLARERLIPLSDHRPLSVILAKRYR